MPEINLPTGLRGNSDTPKQKEVLVNCYLEAGNRPSIVPRPAIDEYATVFGRCRGAGKFKEELYQVSSNLLIRIDENEVGVTSWEDVGGGVTIDGSADCLLIESFTKLLVMVKGGNAYVYDGATLELIDDPEYETSIDAAFIFSRFVFIPEDGGPYFWSDLNDPSAIDPQNFADAEVLPDKNKAVAELNDSLIIGGGATIERHTFNTELDTFQRQSGTTLNIGYVGGMTRYNETLIFIGRPINGTYSVYLYGQNIPISNKAVDEVLNKYSLEELEGVRVDNWSWDGQAMVKWQLPDEDLLFYGDFAFIKSGVSGSEIGHWDAVFIQEFNGKLICGDNSQGRAGVLVNGNTDYGEDIESSIITYVRDVPRSTFLIKWIILEGTTGQTNEDKRISLSVSEDGVHYGPEVPIELGSGAGVYNDEISWNPIGLFDNHCSMEFRWIGDIKFPIDGVYVG
jgi:hypothetical protein